TEILEQRRNPGLGPNPAPILENHPTRSATTIDGWRSALFGIPFIAAGVWISLAAFGFLSVRKHASDWAMGIIGPLFLLGGLFFSSFFAVLGLFFWYRWAQMLADLLRYGNSFLTYDSFPYLLGGTLRARLRAPHHVSDIDALTFTLRCIQEHCVSTGSSGKRSTRVVCYELYKDTDTLNRDRLAGLAGG